MKILVFLSTLLFIAVAAGAQNLSIGAKGGISIPNLTAGSGNQNPINTGYSSRFGPDGALFAQWQFSPLFSLQADIEYSSQGGKKNGLQAINTPDQIAAMFPPGQAPAYLYARYNSEAKMNYLMLPILAGFGWNISKSPWRIYASFGPFVSLLVSAHQVTSGNSPFYSDAAGENQISPSQSFDNNQNIRGQLHRLNGGLEGDVGVKYRFAHCAVFIEGGGNYGLFNIQKNAADGKNETGAASIVLGYAYNF
jgi:hypothetical protein